MKEDTRKHSVADMVEEDVFHMRPFNSGIVADFVIEKAMRRVFNRVVSKEMEEKLQPYAASCAISVIKDVANLHLLNSDSSEPSNTSYSHDWNMSAEPPSQDLDTCARSTLKVKLSRKFALQFNEPDLKKKPASTHKGSKSRYGDFRSSPDEKKPLVYEIKEEKVSDGLEREVEEMRNKKLTEEAKILEEQRNEARKKKKLQEIRDRKNGKAKNPNVDLQSYDFNGKALDVMCLGTLPNLVPKCTKAGDGVKEDEKSSTVGGFNKLQKTQSKVDKMLRSTSSYLQEMFQKTHTKDGGSKPLKYPLGAYDSFVPAAGVTFTEAGKNPKSTNVSIGQHTGKISKSEFQSLVSEHSFVTSTGFFPSIPNKGNTMILSAPPEMENMSKMQISVPEKSWKNMDKTITENVSMSGDLSLLLVDEHTNKTMYNPSSLSVLPRGNLPHLSLRKRESMPQEAKPGPTDLFNLNIKMVEMNGMNMGLRYRPIEKGEKVTANQLKKSIGLGKKLPRVRGIVGLKNKLLKLAPPPLGKTVGHGLISSTKYHTDTYAQI